MLIHVAIVNSYNLCNCRKSFHFAFKLANYRMSLLKAHLLIIKAIIFCAGDLFNATWIADGQLHLEWFESFTSPTPLYYELSLGPQMGSGSIIKWVELSTIQTAVTLSDERLQRSSDYFVALTAISYSGLHTTSNQLLAGMPLEN